MVDVDAIASLRPTTPAKATAITQTIDHYHYPSNFSTAADPLV
jgi:hypothetical protein